MKSILKLKDNKENKIEQKSDPIVKLESDQSLIKEEINYEFLKDQNRLHGFVKNILSKRGKNSDLQMKIKWIRDRINPEDFDLSKYSDLSVFFDCESCKKIVKINKVHTKESRYQIAKILLDFVDFEALPMRDTAYDNDPVYFLGYGVCSARLTSILRSMLGNVTFKITALLIRSTIVAIARLFGYGTEMLLTLAKSESKRCREIVGVRWHNDLIQLRCPDRCGCIAHQVFIDKLPNPFEIFPNTPRGPFLFYAAFKWMEKDFIQKKKYLRCNFKNVPPVTSNEYEQSKILIKKTKELIDSFERKEFPKLIKPGYEKYSFNKIKHYCLNAGENIWNKIPNKIAPADKFDRFNPKKLISAFNNNKNNKNPDLFENGSNFGTNKRKIQDKFNMQTNKDKKSKTFEMNDEINVKSVNDFQVKNKPLDIPVYLNVGQVIAIKWFKRKMSQKLCNFFEILISVISLKYKDPLGERNVLNALESGCDVLRSISAGISTLGPKGGEEFEKSAEIFLKCHLKSIPPKKIAREIYNLWKTEKIKFLETKKRPDNGLKDILFYTVSSFQSIKTVNYASLVQDELTLINKNLQFNVDGIVGACFIDALYSSGITYTELQKYIQQGLMASIFCLGKIIRYAEKFFDT